MGKMSAECCRPSASDPPEFKRLCCLKARVGVFFFFFLFFWYVQKAGSFARTPVQEDKWPQLPGACPTLAVSEGALSFSRQELQSRDSPPFGGTYAQLSPAHELVSKAGFVEGPAEPSVTSDACWEWDCHVSETFTREGKK